MINLKIKQTGAMVDKNMSLCADEVGETNVIFERRKYVNLTFDNIQVLSTILLRDC